MDPILDLLQYGNFFDAICWEVFYQEHVKLQKNISKAAGFILPIYTREQYLAFVRFANVKMFEAISSPSQEKK